MIHAKNICAAILAGGRGERLQSAVDDRPKVLADVNGKPFLSYVLDRLVGQGIRMAVLCVGYKADMIIDFYGDAYKELRLVYSRENHPLGTGGALRLALPHLFSDPVLVLNGDSIAHCDLNSFFAFYSGLVPEKAMAAIASVIVNDAGRFGSLELRPDNRIIAFTEKKAAADHDSPGLINAGIYLFSREFVSSIPQQKHCSLEYDIFPDAARDGRLFCFSRKAPFIDIGTPESYGKAADFLAQGTR